MFSEWCNYFSLHLIPWSVAQVHTQIFVRISRTLLMHRVFQTCVFDFYIHNQHSPSNILREVSGRSAMISDGSYHVTTEFSFYPVVSKIHNSISIYPYFSRRLTYPTRNFEDSQCFECNVIITIALWRHGGGAWHNALFLTTASNCWAGVTKGLHSN